MTSDQTAPGGGGDAAEEVGLRAEAVRRMRERRFGMLHPLS
jgi:hypothetical protein